MDDLGYIENLVHKLIAQIKPNTLLVIVASKDGHLSLCLDHEGFWHECYKSIDQKLTECSLDILLAIFAAVTEKIAGNKDDIDQADFERRVATYVIKNKLDLAQDLRATLEKRV